MEDRYAFRTGAILLAMCDPDFEGFEQLEADREAMGAGEVIRDDSIKDVRDVVRPETPPPVTPRRLCTPNQRCCNGSGWHVCVGPVNCCCDQLADMECQNCGATQCSDYCTARGKLVRNRVVKAAHGKGGLYAIAAA